MRKASGGVPSIMLRRVYDADAGEAGYRVLVDRYWPRGCKRESLHLDAWLRELAPDAELIRWFGHVPERWPAFRERYRAELDQPERRAQLQALLDAAGSQPLVLLYGARNETENQAVVLREALLALHARR